VAAAAAAAAAAAEGHHNKMNGGGGGHGHFAGSHAAIAAQLSLGQVRTINSN
jgi:hypothetical protein